MIVFKRNDEILKFNDVHDPKTGRFTFKNGGLASVKFTVNHKSNNTDGQISTKAKQQYTSAETSINQNKLPAVFNKVNFESGTTNFDNGGGKFDNATEELAKRGVKNIIYDPYNRTKEHNENVISQIKNKKADTSTISNVLNVIQEKEARIEVLRNSKNAIKDGGKCYITIYEGNKTGVGAATSKGYQLNMKTKDYLNEVKEVFPNAVIKNGVIIATK
jgi:hypothetical protein